jgi:hypothetical protein
MEPLIRDGPDDAVERLRLQAVQPAVQAGRPAGDDHVSPASGGFQQQPDAFWLNLEVSRQSDNGVPATLFDAEA